MQINVRNDQNFHSSIQTSYESDCIKGEIPFLFLVVIFLLCSYEFKEQQRWELLQLQQWFWWQIPTITPILNPFFFLGSSRFIAYTELSLMLFWSFKTHFPLKFETRAAYSMHILSFKMSLFEWIMIVLSLFLSKYAFSSFLRMYISLSFWVIYLSNMKYMSFICRDADLCKLKIVDLKLTF